jgi:hypothetical protein
MKQASLILKKAPRRACLSVVVLALMLYTGCATVLRIEDDRLNQAAVAALPSDRDAYLFLDASAMGTVLEQTALSFGGGSGRVGEILENIDYIYAAIGMNPEVETWTIIGTGNFPVSTYAFALDFDPGWKRAPGLARRWISADGKMEVALPGPQIIVVGSQETDTVTDRLGGMAIAGGTSGKSFFEALLIKPHPGVVAYVLEAGGLLPIELPLGLADDFAVLVSGNFSGDTLIAEIIFNFDSSAKARVAALVIRTISLSDRKKEKAGSFSEAQVSVDGDSVTVSGVVIESAVILEYLTTVRMEGGGDK